MRVAALVAAMVTVIEPVQSHGKTRKQEREVEGLY